MVAKEQLLELKAKLLPSGGDFIVDILTAKHERLEFTQIVLENVPLLIIGRHGIIARIPIQGRLEKVSQPEEIARTLNSFFQGLDQQTLYVFINLPDLPVPQEITKLLEEVNWLVQKKDKLESQINEALDKRNKQAFDRAVQELLKSRHEYYDNNTHHKLNRRSVLP